MDNVDVLEERFIGLRTWLDERFERMNDRFDQMCAEREDDRQVVETLRERVFEHEDRLIRLERVAWLAVGLAGFLSPVVVWAVIEIIKVLGGI